MQKQTEIFRQETWGRFQERTDVEKEQEKDSENRQNYCWWGTRMFWEEMYLQKVCHGRWHSRGPPLVNLFSSEDWNLGQLIFHLSVYPWQRVWNRGLSSVGGFPQEQTKPKGLWHFKIKWLSWKRRRVEFFLVFFFFSSLVNIYWESFPDAVKTPWSQGMWNQTEEGQKLFLLLNIWNWCFSGTLNVLKSFT